MFYKLHALCNELGNVVRPTADYVFAGEEFVVELNNMKCPYYIASYCSIDGEKVIQRLLSTGNYRNLSIEWSRNRSVLSLSDDFGATIKGVSNIDRRSEGDIVSDILSVFQKLGWKVSVQNSKITVYRKFGTTVPTVPSSTSGITSPPSEDKEKKKKDDDGFKIDETTLLLGGGLLLLALMLRR